MLAHTWASQPACSSACGCTFVSGCPQQGVLAQQTKLSVYTSAAGGAKALLEIPAYNRLDHVRCINVPGVSQASGPGHTELRIVTS